jgi:hypothetical protein
MTPRGSKKAAAKPKTRLRLSKETLRDLDASARRDVRGGSFGSNVKTHTCRCLTHTCLCYTGVC